MKPVYKAVWVLCGQVVGYLFGVMVLTMTALSSGVLPLLASPAVDLALYIITFTILPILCSWLLLRRVDAYSNPIVVCIGSYVFALSTFVGLVRMTDGSRHSVGISLLRALVLVPTASILGSLLTQFVQQKARRRAG